MGLKQSGETWSLIASALGRNKKKVQQRYKTLVREQSLLQNSPSDDDDESEFDQLLHIQQQIRNNLHPAYLGLDPESRFMKQDCKVLAEVEDKMQRGKWLEMQANFSNATGKMVPLSIIRARCEAIDAEEQTRARDDKIAAWKAGLNDSEHLDLNGPSDVGSMGF